MANVFEKNMEGIFDLAPIPENLPAMREEKTVTYNIENERAAEEDYKYVRENLKAVIDESMEFAEELKQLAISSQAPRAAEVYSNLIKTIVESNRELLEAAKAIKEINEENRKKNNNPDVKGVVVCTTKELLEAFKNKEG